MVEEGRETLRRLLKVGDLPPSFATQARPESPAAYDAAFDRVLARAAGQAVRTENERLEAASFASELAEELGQRTLEELRERIEGEAGDRRWALAEQLCARSFEAGLEDPERAVGLARLAIAAAEGAAVGEGAGTIGQRLGGDRLAASWGQLGNALRIASELREAEQAFELAKRHMARGTGDPLAEAELLSLEASLARDHSRFDEGVELCRRACKLYRRAGDRHGVARMWIQEADLHARRGKISAADDCLDRALADIDADAEPRLILVILHNLVSYLDQQERYDEAWQRLREAEALAVRVGSRLDRVRLRWLEGRVAAHLGREALAEVCWREARHAFVELGIPFDAALVALELSALMARAGRHLEMRELVEEMVPIFEAQELRGEAQAALKVFRDAARSQSAGVELIREVARRLESTRRQPGIDELFKAR